MHRKSAFLLGVVIAAAISAYAIGQQQTTERGSASSFTVAPVGDTAVLLDTRTGQTWLLSHSNNKDNPSAWLPTIKIDGLDEATKWRATEHGLTRLDKLRGERSLIQARVKDPTTNKSLAVLEKQIADLEAKLSESN
jgi:hypothetical protein